MEDEIYSQFDLWFTEKLAWLLFGVSIISTGLLLWLAYSGARLSLPAAVAAVLLGSFTVTLGLWQSSLRDCLMLEYARRVRHRDWQPKVIGTVGWPVFRIMMVLALKLTLGYIAIAGLFGAAFHASKGTTSPDFWSSVYYSLITLATVGYGDVTPVGFGRVLSGIEVVIALLYNVVVLSSAIAVFSKLAADPSIGLGVEFTRGE